MKDQKTMTPFLAEVAQFAFQRQDAEQSDYVYIFPNKRAGIFFRKYFAQIAGKTVWAPNTYTIQDFIQNHSELNLADKLSLLFELHAVFNGFRPDKPMDFDQFYPMGEIVLSDFNDIDNYLVNAKKLFINVKALNELTDLDYLTEEQRKILSEFWQFFEAANSSEKSKLFKLWQLLPDLYQAFDQHLRKKGMAYEGKMYRSVLEALEQKKSLFAKDNYVFVGFNALNKAQEGIFLHLQQQNKALFFWDTDSYYLDETRQEAGLFLRRNIRLFGESALPQLSRESGFTTKSKSEIKVISTALDTHQAQLVHDFLSKIKEENRNPEKSAIILANEQLLFPVLQSIPDGHNPVNITMGFPLRETLIFTLLQAFINLHAHATQRSQIWMYYAKDVKLLLFNENLRQDSGEAINELWEKLSATGHNRIDAAQVLESDLPFIELAFSPVKKGSDLLTNMLNLLYLLFVNFSADEAHDEMKLEKEYIYHTYLHLKRLRDLFTYKQQFDSKQLVIKLLRQTLREVSIPFSGESTDGVQIMGILESRNLDFEQILVLGLNEGVFPKQGRAPSFINESLRHAFELPVMNQQDAIFAYIFYRLLQRATDITLVYNSLNKNAVGGEPSRFLKQLEIESELEFSYSHVRQNIKLQKPIIISIEKDDTVMRRLQAYVVSPAGTNETFSASALNTYLDCKLKFYFRYVARLKPVDSYDNEISPADFGNLLHGSIERLYKIAIRKKQNPLLESADLKAVIPMRIKVLNELISELLYNGNSINEEDGNLLIIREVISNYLKQIIQMDMRLAPFEIIDLEAKKGYEAHIDAVLKGRKVKVALRGIIDRIDKKDRYVRIIDYKTGNYTDVFANMEALFTPDRKNSLKALFQIFFYGLLFEQNSKEYGKSSIPVIYGILKMQQENFDGQIRIKDGKSAVPIHAKLFSSLLDDFKDYLSDLISEIFDHDQSFSQTENTRICDYCDYKTICNR